MTTLKNGETLSPEELEAFIAGLSEEEKNGLEAATRAHTWINNYGVKYRIEMFGRNTDINKPKRDLLFEIAAGGGSYTDGKNVRLALPETWFERDEKDYVRFMKFVAAHELGHINWSDFKIFVDFQKRAESYFEKKFGIRGAGRFAGEMLNITEDGRIERAQANVMPGLLKYIRYVNRVNYDAFTSNQLGIVPLNDFRNVTLTLAKIGLLPTGYNSRIKGTDTDVAIQKAMPLIIQAIRSQTAKGCADATWEILMANEAFIAEAMEPFEIDEETLKKMLEEDLSEAQSDDSGSGPSGPSMNMPGSAGGSSEGSDASEGADPSDDSSSDSDDSKGADKGDGEDGQDAGTDGEDGDKKSGQTVTIDPLKSMSGEADYSNRPTMAKAPKGNVSTHASDEENTAKGQASEIKKGDGDEEEGDGFSLDQLIVETDSESVDFLDKAKDAAKRENDRVAREDAERQKTEVSQKDINGVLSAYRNGMDYRYTQEVFANNGPISPAVMKQGRGLRRDLKDIFNDKRGWTLANQRSGMLDDSQLYRAGSGLQQNDIFIKRQLPEETSWVVSLLVDNSGSMSGSVHNAAGNRIGEKVTVARHATAMLEIALQGVVPLKIARFDVTWGGGGTVVQHAKVRGWEQQTKKILSWDSTDRTGSGNADAMSIGVAVEELKRRPETKKMLIVLSDGLPSENTPKQVKKVIESARKEGVKVIGIGFGPEDELKRNGPTYRDMYGTDIVLAMPDQLSKELVKVLRKTIAYGM